MLEALIGVLGLVCVAAFGWAIQLSGRVAAMETKQGDIIDLLTVKFDGVTWRLDRIERGMNGHLTSKR